MTGAESKRPIALGPLLVGLVVGALIGALGFGLLGGVFAFAALRKQQADARRGWNLVPVVAAAVDIPAGKEVVFDDLSQRSDPEQFASVSMVRPEQASRVVNRPINVPLLAGDPLLWSQFEVSWPALVRRCTFEVDQGRRLDGETGGARALLNFKKSLEGLPAGPR